MVPQAQGKRNPSKMVGIAKGHQRADTLKPYSQKTSQSNHTRTTALSNSMKPSHACGATQDGWVMVERADRMWSTGEGNGTPLQYSCLENPLNRMKRQNDRILNEELPRSLGAQYDTGDQWRNNSRKNEGMVCQSKNNTQLWMRLVIEARSNAVKAVLNRNLECQVPESRQIGSGQTRDGKIELHHSRNQQTKMDWNG